MKVCHDEVMKTKILDQGRMPHEQLGRFRNRRLQMLRALVVNSAVSFVDGIVGVDTEPFFVRIWYF